MLAVSGRGAGLLGARGGWAERERTGGEKGDGPRRERENGLGRLRSGRGGVGLAAGLGWALSWVSCFGFGFLFLFLSKF